MKLRNKQETKILQTTAKQVLESQVKEKNETIIHPCKTVYYYSFTWFFPSFEYVGLQISQLFMADWNKKSNAHVVYLRGHFLFVGQGIAKTSISE